MMGDGSDGGDDDEDDSVCDGWKTCQVSIPALEFNNDNIFRDILASSINLGNQLGLTTSMVGEVVLCVGVVEDWSGVEVNKGSGGKVTGVGRVWWGRGLIRTKRWQLVGQIGVILGVDSNTGW